MAERRSIGNAMAMTPEKLAFIKGDVAKEKTVELVSVPEEPNTETAQARSIGGESSRPAAPTQMTGATSTAASSSRARRARRPVERASDATDAGPYMSGLLAPLTTRLNPHTADALRRATLEQRLRRQKPATQQEIVEEAIHHWLSENGYL